MKRIMLCTMLILLSTAQLRTQEYGWRVIATPRPGYQLKVVEFIDSLHGWCANLGDNFWRTTDGGHTWDSVATSPMVITAISMFDTLSGWAVGGFFSGGGPYDGKIVHTTDGGKNWLQQMFVSDRQYWGVAAQGTLRGTVAGVSTNVGLDTGKLVTTSDGGQQWTESTHADSITYLGQIQFVDSLHGWMSGRVHDPSVFPGRPVLLRTTNAGSSWQLIDKPVGFFSFVDTAHGFAYGGRNTVGETSGLFLVRTQNGGITWDSTFIADTSVYNDQITVTAVSFVDTLNGWFFGNTFFEGGSREIIIRTTDGGATWKRESVGISDVIGDAMMLDGHHGWAVSLSGEVLGYELITGVIEHMPELPRGFTLRQNYPNPFNNSTVIEYEIPREADVQIAVYDGIGKLIATLVDRHQTPGVYRVGFDAAGLSSGVYYYTMEARPEDDQPFDMSGGQSAFYRNTKQLILLK